jgi:DNA end-binding protein Ku
MRTTWNGSISFGLVNIPVGLAPATKPAARQSDIAFRTLHRECGTPIRQKRWCPTHDREVGPDEIVKGWEVSKGEFVLVEDSDLEAIERADTSRSIEIWRFVPAEEVDAIFFDRTYFLAPAAAQAAHRPYVLLSRAMHETGMAALGRFVLAGKEKLCLIRARGEALVLETLFLSEDVFSQAEIDEAVSDAEVKTAELDLARQIIAGLAGEFEPAELTSDYRRNLKELLEAKLSGREVATPEPAPETPVVDLMDALRQSVAEAKSRRASAGDDTGDGKPKKKAAAAKPATDVNGKSAKPAGSRSRSKSR